MSYLWLGRCLFWFAVALVATTIFIVVEPGYTISLCSPLVQSPGPRFFGASLNLTLSIISLVFIVVIFLVQNANQGYSSRLSSVILTEPHFPLTIAFILVGSVFSISGGYFSFGAPYTLLSYAFSLATVLVVCALIAFAAHFINVENIVRYVTNRIKKNISSSQIYQWRFLSLGLHDERYIDQLSSQTQLIVSTCIRAIEQNHEPVVDSCLSSLTKIAEKFVQETGRIEADDDYLLELNDQFRFIASTPFNEYSRQKYAEKVAEAAGDIGSAVAKRRKLGTAGAHWASLLKEILADSLNFDRTSAPHTCINKLGEMSVASIEGGDESFRNDSVRSCVGEISSISSLCLSKPNIYTASLAGNVCLQYQKIYCSYFRKIARGGGVIEYDIDNVLEGLASTLLESKRTFSGPATKQSVFSSTFGIESFSSRILDSANECSEYLDDRSEYINDELNRISYLMGEISRKYVRHNYRLIYQGYTNLVFSFYNICNNTDSIKPIENLNDERIYMIRNEYLQSIEDSEHVNGELNNEIGNFNAIIIYLYKGKSEVVSNFIEPLAKLYLDLDQKHDRSDHHTDQNLQKLYGQLKLAGAWINQYCDVDTEAPNLWKALTKDFSKVGSESPVVGSIMADYGYPVKPSSHGGGWSLRPDNLWAYTGFQQEIERELNGEQGQVYLDFHNLLEQCQG